MILPNEDELREKSNERLALMAKEAFLYLLTIGLVAHDRGCGLFVHTDKEIEQYGEKAAKEQQWNLGDENDINEARLALLRPKGLHMEIRPLPANS